VKLLLDTHIAKATLGALAKVVPRLHAEHIAQWRGGSLRSASDAEILAACQEEKRVFVTFDQATVPGLLRHRAAEGRDHAGVFFGDENTIRPNSPAEVAASLAALAEEIGTADTANMVRFLCPAEA
jgi:hypothetical protein